MKHQLRRTLVVCILPLVSLPALAVDTTGLSDRGEATPIECIDPATGAYSQISTIECFNALLNMEGVRKVFRSREMVPATADGRVSIKDLKFNIRAEAKVGVDREGQSTADIEGSRHNQVLGAAEIEELKRATGFDIKLRTIGGQGPTTVKNIDPPPPGGFPVPPPNWEPSPENPNYLDIAGFNSELHTALRNNVNGYAMKMRRDGETVGILQWNWSRNPNVGDAPAQGWNTDRRMHVASVSKLMTAIGLIHVLDANGVDTDEFIVDYLPDYWDPGANVGLITFEHLLNHASGFITGGSNADWPTMKNTVESPVNAALIGNYGNTNYENMNFGLMRILISTIGGFINPAADFGSEAANDQMWDSSTSSFYNQYMQVNVFNPHGAFPTLTKNATSTRAYTFNATGSGWNSGSFTGRPGGMGWHMTITEILDVMRALREGKILSASSTSELLNQSWGLSSPVLGESTAAGLTYFKAGRWTDNINIPSIARSEQCFVFLMPDDMELAIFVNSEIGFTGQSLSGLVRGVYENNIIQP